MFEGVLGLYCQLFYFMEDKGILDPFNDLHIAALHHVFLPKINEKLELWRNAWSRHRVTTMKSSPLRVWVAGQLQNPVGIEDNFVDVEHYGVEGVLHDERDEDSRPIFEMPYPLSNHCLESLRNQVPSSWNSTNYGIDVYLQALSITENSSGRHSILPSITLHIF